MPHKNQTYRVFYARFPYDLVYSRRSYGGGPTTIFTIEKLPQTHVFLCEVLATTIEDVYWQMQGEHWSPHGEARPLIEKLGLRHTSMTIGDVVQAPSPNGRGRLFVCTTSGWEELRDTPDITAQGTDSLLESLAEAMGMDLPLANNSEEVIHDLLARDQHVTIGDNQHD
jgi:hypothetical protein